MEQKEKKIDESYCSSCGEIIKTDAEICPHCGVRQKKSSPLKGEKNRIVAALLAIFLGGIGAHKFYLGEIFGGLMYLCLCWTFIPALVGLIEGLIYLSKSDEAFEKKYG